MKSARACRNLTDIRGAVNAIDRELIRLLVTRRRYALAALAFKPDRGSVAVPQHRKKIFAQRESWAVRAGLNPTMVHKIFQAVFDESKRLHLAGLRARRGQVA